MCQWEPYIGFAHGWGLRIAAPVGASVRSGRACMGCRVSGLGYLSFAPKNHRRTGMYTGAAICDFTAVRTKAHMEGSPAQGAGPSSGSLEIRVRCSRRKHSSETSRENISAMG